jgi:hypothetical protein
MCELSKQEMKDLFNNELLLDNDNYDNICLISYKELGQHIVTLPCNHTFNYIPLYNEIIKHKNINNRIENRKIGKYQIKCPYCRTIHNNVLPYIEMEGVEYIIGINGPKKFAIYPNRCIYIPKTGKNKGLQCKTRCMGEYCTQHKKYELYKNECIYVPKTGKNKGIECKEKCIDEYCTLHKKYKK